MDPWSNFRKFSGPPAGSPESLLAAAISAAVQAGASRQVCAAITAAAIRSAAAPADAATENFDIIQRVKKIKQGLELHRELEQINGTHSHHLGAAIAEARGHLDPDTRRAARQVQRRSNDARHAAFDHEDGLLSTAPAQDDAPTKPEPTTSASRTTGVQTSRPRRSSRAVQWSTPSPASPATSSPSRSSASSAAASDSRPPSPSAASPAWFSGSNEELMRYIDGQFKRLHSRPPTSEHPAG